MAFEIYTPWGTPELEAGYVKPTPRIFEDFLLLGSASDTEIYDFASRFGPLMIYCRTVPSRGATEFIHERSEVWRYFARCMNSLLQIAADIHSGRNQKAADWDAIGACPFPVDSAKWRIKDSDVMNPLAFQPEESWSAIAYFIKVGEHRDRETWARLLTALLTLGRAEPRIIWQTSRRSAQPQMVFGAPRLLSYLALQLCLASLKQDALAMCSHCRREYASSRAPKSGQRNFCPDCRQKGVPALIAKRDSRARVRETSKEG